MLLVGAAQPPPISRFERLVLDLDVPFSEVGIDEQFERIRAHLRREVDRRCVSGRRRIRSSTHAPTVASQSRCLRPTTRKFEKAERRLPCATSAGGRRAPRKPKRQLASSSYSETRPRSSLRSPRCADPWPTLGPNVSESAHVAMRGCEPRCPARPHGCCVRRHGWGHVGGSLPARQAGGHWFEPSTAHLTKAPLMRGFSSRQDCCSRCREL